MNRCLVLCALLMLGMPAMAKWSITDLGAGFVPTDINDKGVVLSAAEGLRINNAGQILKGLSLITGGVATPLDGLFEAYALNDLGQVGGSACGQGRLGSNDCLPAVWTSGTITPLCPGDCAGTVLSLSFANIAGGYFTNRAEPEQSTGFADAGGVRTLFPLGGVDRCSPCSRVDSVNQAGLAVGSYTIPDDNEQPTGQAFIYANASIQDLPAWGGFGSRALSINSAGQVVGHVITDPDAQSFRAALWQGTWLKAVDLSALAEVQAAGWTELRTAVAINDLGQVVGVGIRDGVEHGYLLAAPLPVPEPGTWALLLAGLAAVSAMAARRRHA